jgi:hypothetical protein
MKQLTAGGEHWGDPVEDDFDRVVAKVFTEIGVKYGLSVEDVKRAMIKLEVKKDDPGVDWEKTGEQILEGLKGLGL